jgi:hypothetical protein
MNRISRVLVSLTYALIVLAIICTPVVGRSATVATPTIAPGTESTVGSIPVKITCASGATCYYTNAAGTTGTTPSSNVGTKFSSSASFTVSTSSVVEAIATENGYTSSSVAKATYTITPVSGTLSVYISAPIIQWSEVPGIKTETFDTLTPKESPTPYTTTYTSTLGAYTGSTSAPFAIIAPGEFGGAKDSSSSTQTTNYFAVGKDSGSVNPVYLTLTNPVSYFGFWWSAGDQYNRVALYSGNTLYGTFSTADLLTFLKNGSGTIKPVSGIRTAG